MQQAQTHLSVLIFKLKKLIYQQQRMDITQKCNKPLARQ